MHNKTSLHHVETVDAGRNPATRRRRENSPNMLIHGDNKDVMAALLPDFRGKIDLIYVDPPFDVGTDFRVRVPVGSDGRDEVEVVAYNDSWGRGPESYADMMYERLVLMRELLSERGSLYLHCDHRTTALFRNMLDDIFGTKNHVNEIIWFYKTGGTPEKLGFGKKHDTIHFYVKSRKRAIWNPQKEKSYLKHRYGFSNIEILEDDRGRYTLVNCRDVFDIPALRGNQPERVDFPTQKPEALLERIIRASSNAGDLVADFFCGSGTTGVVANRLARRWIMADRGALAVHTSRKRIIASAPAAERALDVHSTEPAASGAAIVDVEAVAAHRNGDHAVDIRLKRFVPDPEGVAAHNAAGDLGDGLSYVDYWAVDFRGEVGEPFRHDWADFRTRNDRALKTTSDCGYVYSDAASRSARVKIIDVLGRETICTVDIPR